MLYPHHLTLTFPRMIFFEPVIMFFIPINGSTVKYILSSESIKIFFMYINAFFNLSKLISPNSFSEANIFFFRASNTRGTRGHGSTTFLHSKKKKEKQRKKKSFKAETIERLSARSKCYCFRHSRVSRIQKFSLSTNHGGQQYFSVFHAPSTLKSILPALILT